MPTQVDNMIVRCKLTKTNDKGEQQLIKATGRKGEVFGGANDDNGIPVLQPYGRTANCPEGTLFHTVTPDGQPDKAMAIGAHSKYRKKEQEAGQVCDYDMWGHTMQMKEDGWHWKIGSSEMIFGHDGTVTITATTINIIGDVHLGSTGGILAAKLGSTDNDTESNGSDAITGNVATKVWVT